MSALQDIDLIGLDPETIAALEEVARREHMLAALQEQAMQEELARQYPEMNAVDGLGEVRRNISAFAYHDWALKMGTHDCWSDKGFNKYIDRLAPETRVKCVAPKSGNGLALQVGWAPVREPRFRKTYPAEEKMSRGEKGNEADPSAPLPLCPSAPLPQTP